MGEESVQAAVVRTRTVDATIRALVRKNKRREAFDLLYTTYERRLYNLCLRFFRNPTQAEDALQESLEVIWLKLDGYRGWAPLLHWLRKVTRRCCLAQLEKHNKQVPPTDEETDARNTDCNGCNGDSNIEKDALRMDLDRIIDSLPEHYRHVVILYYNEDRSVEDVAELLGVPEGTVKTLLFRARRILDERLRLLGLNRMEIWLEEDT